jgi:hypothetical protein
MKVHQKCHAKSLTLHKSILHRLTHSYQFFHILKISKANSSIIERQKMMKLFFCHFLIYVFVWTSSEWELNNFIAISGFQALCVWNVSHLDSFSIFFLMLMNQRKKFQDMNRKLIYCERKWCKSFFFVFLIERPITLFYWI